jgi:hypothetical protein
MDKIYIHIVSQGRQGHFSVQKYFYSSKKPNWGRNYTTYIRNVSQGMQSHLSVQEEVPPDGEQVGQILQHRRHRHPKGLEREEAGEDHPNEDEIDGEPELDDVRVEFLHPDEAQQGAEADQDDAHHTLEEEQAHGGVEVEAAERRLVEEHHARRCCTSQDELLLGKNDCRIRNENNRKDNIGRYKVVYKSFE